MKQVFIMAHDTARRLAIQAIAQAPEGHVVEIKERTRSIEQNAKLHAMLTDISRQCMYMSKRRSVEFWKGLFVSGWMMATGQRPEMVPGLEGEFINIRVSTASLGVKKLAEIIEYISAWGAAENVKFSDTRDWQ